MIAKAHEMGPSAPSFKSERRPAKLVVQASTTVLHRIHMSWRDVLVSYAKTQEPSSSLPDEVLLLSTEHTLTIFDKYPKAKYHFLTLPRLPFADPVSQSDVPQAVLGSLSSLIASKYGLSVLRVLKEASLEVVETIQEEMLKKEGFTWPISVGFHAVESLAHVHLHIISQDFISDALKNKKHWNSFNPDHGFFLHLDDLLEWVDKGTLKQHNKSKSAYEKLLNEPIKCYKCDETFGTVPRLKEHLLEDFETLRRAAVGGTTSSSAEGQAEKKHEADSVDGESDAKRRKQK